MFGGKKDFDICRLMLALEMMMFRHSRKLVAAVAVVEANIIMLDLIRMLSDTQNIIKDDIKDGGKVVKETQMMRAGQDHKLTSNRVFSAINL